MTFIIINMGSDSGFIFAACIVCLFDSAFNHRTRVGLLQEPRFFGQEGIPR